MSQVINNTSNKENARVPLANIKNQQPVFQQQQLKKPTSFVPQQQQPTTVSRVSLYKQEHSLENALKRIRELEEQIKIKDETISQLKLDNENLCNSVVVSSADEKINSKLTNNRIRKIQQLSLENVSLKDSLQQSQFNNEKCEKLDIKLTNNRIRTIQKLKIENQQLRKLLSNNNSNSNVEIVETQPQPQQEELSNSNFTTPPIEFKVQSPTQLKQQTLQQRIQSLGYEDFDYGVDNEHPGEC